MRCCGSWHVSGWQTSSGMMPCCGQKSRWQVRQHLHAICMVANSSRSWAQLCLRHQSDAGDGLV
jgi:hypothetical protein